MGSCVADRLQDHSAALQGGKPTGEYQDFVVGFVADDQNVWGRPVDVTFAKDGSLLFSDDGNDVVYRVTYRPE